MGWLGCFDSALEDAIEVEQLKQVESKSELADVERQIAATVNAGHPFEHDLSVDGHTMERGLTAEPVSMVSALSWMRGGQAESLDELQAHHSALKASNGT